ncbi:hypothetical protein DCAR_0104110 [Daucus carota subsp. sativus]|uniref:Uncharacterized protein n=1 Tax=Daucus carota subsp. sativus TaxID=79200 RepID=A0A166IK58_DAUCS|nr:PREDICTED: uncharacterized protein LOC108205174 [Daucus carota subsp. sativus]XP_017230484.1 PREDICTED: uncharacterized protein LOC108205174 [Daucus carota subsp. sativus]WOG84925.1 hypothetical protein DCAR_0104110 [Daucus carota subsp. sativus]
MGCAASRIDKDERVRICKERKRLMKQVVRFRGVFAEAQLEYLTALKNTGATLRQFTESDSLELDDNPFGATSPPSPPPPLPPSPPPPPTFSPDPRKVNNNHKLDASQEESIEFDEDNSCTPPPPPLPSSSWEFWDPFGNSAAHYKEKSETVDQIEEECWAEAKENSDIVDQVEEENWAEANTEFEEENLEEEAGSTDLVNLLSEKPHRSEFFDDNSSVMSWHTKDTSDMAMVVSMSKRTLANIVRELDDCFLKASSGGKNIGVLMDITVVDSVLWQKNKENKRKRSNSVKVFSALTWSWSSRSLNHTRDIIDFSDPSEACKPGAHCITLRKLCDEEHKLYKEVKEEEMNKLEHEKKSLQLQKQQMEDQDWTKTEKTRASVESLQSEIIRLQQSISRTCSTILVLINEELHPQLSALTSGLMHMWKKMFDCHQVQTHISQQVNHLSNYQCVDPTTDYHKQAAAQLKSEVTSWCDSFCKLIKFQREYVRTMSRWIKLTDCLVENSDLSSGPSAVHALCENWHLALDKLPEKAAEEAIKSFLSAIHAIVLQQEDELSLLRRSDKLEKKLRRELNSMAEMEMKFEGSFNVENPHSGLSPKHPLVVKRAKVEALKKQVDDEKAKYLSSVEVTRVMTLNNLKTSLPNVFRALMGFASAYSQAFEVIHSATP